MIPPALSTDVCARASRGVALALGIGLALAAGSLLGPVRYASAEGDHEVRRGQTWSGIARRYGVSPGALAAANGKSSSSALREGQTLRVPSRGEIFVAPGESLAELASRHDTSVDELARANRMKPSASLRAGQLLALPGFARGEEAVAAEKKWGRPKRAGAVTFVRLYPREQKRVSLVDARGRVRRNAIDQLTRLMRPKDSKKRKAPHPRLLRLLAQVSDHFGGRPLHIVSGFRVPGGNTKDTSQHVAGHAMDFRIPGVPLETIRAYCAQLNHVGVGLYPRSKFIHLDVRNRDARWTDWSLPGEPAQKRKPGEDADDDGRSPGADAEDSQEAAEPEAEVGEAPIDDGTEVSDEP